MTGFNVRIVNPKLVPLKGYWTVLHDSGTPGQVWEKVTWNAFLPSGCSIEVYVRAHDDRQTLANGPFVEAEHDVVLNNVKGRYIEVRVGMIRPSANEEPELYDLTLHGL
jgi:hypothetical protein